MKCHECGTDAQKGDKFCLKCGTLLTEKTTHTSDINQSSHAVHEASVNATLPAEQAEKLLKDARKMVKHLTNEELVMGGASIVVFVSFFLPWYGGLAVAQNGFSLASFNNWYYLLPLLALVSIALLYFSQGSKHDTKVFLTTLQAVIGMYILATGIHITNSSSLLGLWLTLIAGGILTGTSLYFQKKFLLKD